MKEKHVAIRIQQCLALAEASNCPRRKFGALLLDPERNVILMDGYNGGPRGGGTLCGGDECLRDTQQVKSGTQMEVGCHHAEMNVVCNAAASGVACRGAWLIVTGEPCVLCAKLIHHAGIVRVLVVEGGYLGANGVQYLRDHGVEVVGVEGPQDPRIAEASRGVTERSAEHARIARLLPRLHSSDELLVPGGDDAAVFRGKAEPLVATVDTVVEGVHFRRSFAPLDVLARRAVMGAASDLAAMGARPRGVLVAFVLPKALTDEDFEALMAGVEKAALELDAVVAGGNLSGGEPLSLTTTALGHLEGPSLRRGGARVGDGIFLTAPPGHAALGLESLLREEAPEGIAPYRRAWLEPTAAIEAGLALSGRAHAAIDLSDGLAQDLGHVCRASGVGATLELPPDPGFERCARALGADPRALQLRGGESYTLLYTAPDPCGLESVRVGTIDEAEGLRLREGDEARPIDGPGGFDHFAGGGDDE